MERKAVIDIGTNSIKYLVAERMENGSIRPVMDYCDIVRIGEGMCRTGVISMVAMDRNVESIIRFIGKAMDLDVDEIVAVGTMALRSAVNSGDFQKYLKRRCDMDLRILSGSEEARLSYLSIVSGLEDRDGDIVVFDSGGGSTEFIFGRGRSVLRSLSVDVGAVVITDRYLRSDPVAEDDVRRAEAHIGKKFFDIDGAGADARIFGIGGTVMALGMVRFGGADDDFRIADGKNLSLGDVESQIALYRGMTVEKRRLLTGLQAGRADIILGGACIVRSIMLRLGVEQITISGGGLRNGLMYEIFGEERAK